jgi:hypothetical protein
MTGEIPKPLEARTDLTGREVYCACLLHGVHRVYLVDTPSYLVFFGRKVQVGVFTQPVSETCNPGCGAVFIHYEAGKGPECHCLDKKS